MTRPLKRAAVIGAGPLGSEIAAALANAGIETLLLDRPAPPPERSSLAFEALDRMARADPPLFHVPEKARFIRVGNLEDDLGRLGACEWIIECAPDRLEVKREWLRSIEPARAADAVVSTSTERLRVAEIARGRSEAFRRHWLGTHFHTPVRYVRLIELVPTPQTLPEVVDTTAAWADRLLGKEIVPSHDTPFFIAKRIACFAALRALSLAEETSLDLELLDTLTGPLLGFPKGGTSGLATRLGSETLTAAAEVVAGGFFTPRALDLGRLRGRSSGPEPASLAAGRAEADLARRVRLLIDSQDAAGSFVWPFLRDLLIYSAALVPVVSARYRDVDCAARRGLGWEAGPFELWQALGIEDIAGRIQADGRALPGWVAELLRQPDGLFYVPGRGHDLVFDIEARELVPVAEEREKIRLAVLRRSGRVIRSNAEASLVDLGEAVACFEFHAQPNPFSSRVLELGARIVEWLEGNASGLVIGNQGTDFSPGANLRFVLELAEAGRWQEMDSALQAFQRMVRAFRYARQPVVGAPFGRVLAAGTEICLGCDALVAAAETAIGLVECGVGLVPAGGGTTALLRRHLEEARAARASDLFPAVNRAFETLRNAVVSRSAEEARRLRFLRGADTIEVNPDRLIFRAKEKVLALAAAGYTPPRADQPIVALGRPGRERFADVIAHLQRKGGMTEHEALVAGRLADVLTGGECRGGELVPEQRLLDLEREAFLSLCGDARTRERMAQTLRN